MFPTKAYAAKSAKTPLEPWSFTRREPGPSDVQIEILYCGVCHSDIHSARDEWGGAVFPMVPGHEIVGRVTKPGARVTRFKTGDLVGVGCMVDSCRKCAPCKEGMEQFCETGATFTYNSTEQDKKTQTYGGYASQIVVTEDFVLKMPANLAPERIGPLLCAGITTYSPLKHWKAGPGKKVAIVGLGGLGHMAVKLAASMGAEVTVLSQSNRKREDARRLGAHEFAATADAQTFKTLANRFDLIIDTVSAPHDYNAYLGLLRRDASMVIVGVPDQPAPVSAFSLIFGRKSLSGSLIGGVRETQEMLDYCGKHNVMPDVEVIPIQKINEAYDRMVKGDVRYRFVVDMKSL